MKAIVRLMSVPAEKRDLAWVQESLRAAVQLELSTIAPYLYAAWSIDPGPGKDPSSCADTIKEIAQEEMLHLGVAANLLVAVGGRPDFVRAAQQYPTQLPMHVHQGLIVGLAPLSQEVLTRTFMVIEEPVTHLFDDDLFAPSGDRLIGQFYAAVLAALVDLAPPFSTARQVDLGGLGIAGAKPFRVASVEDARDAIDLITRQGEGTATGPFEGADPQELAHFYQFAE